MDHSCFHRVFADSVYAAGILPACELARLRSLTSGCPTVCVSHSPRSTKRSADRSSCFCVIAHPGCLARLGQTGVHTGDSSAARWTSACRVVHRPASAGSLCTASELYLCVRITAFDMELHSRRLEMYPGYYPDLLHACAHHPVHAGTASHVSMVELSIC